MRKRLRVSGAVVAAVCLPAAVAGRAGAVVVIDYVPVGDPGNLADPATSRGSVAAPYLIGRTEVTNAQYTEFLNAVDPTGGNVRDLYTSPMASDANAGGINFVAGNPDGSKYVVQAGEGNRPVTYVSWFDAARMANWLHNGQGAGSTETGVYTLTGNTSASGGRAAGATVFLPTENEWYKAAYHQPAAAGGDADNYWLYPMGSNAIPHSDNPTSLNTPDDTNVGNFFRNDIVANGFDDGYAVPGTASFPPGNALTDVGAYTLAGSFYGTFDQGGNVFEWTESDVGGFRAVRGGSWDNSFENLPATFGPANNPALELSGIGFRLAAVPEPACGALLLLLAIPSRALGRRRTRRPGGSASRRV